MSQQIKSPDEELAIALERCLNRWKSRDYKLESITIMISNAEHLVCSFKVSGEFSETDRFRAKQLVNLANARIIQG